jgi:hypothetical protein
MLHPMEQHQHGGSSQQQPRFHLYDDNSRHLGHTDQADSLFLMDFATTHNGRSSFNIQFKNIHEGEMVRKLL